MDASLFDRLAQALAVRSRRGALRTALGGAAVAATGLLVSIPSAGAKKKKKRRKSALTARPAPCPRRAWPRRSASSVPRLESAAAPKPIARVRFRLAAGRAQSAVAPWARHAVRMETVVSPSAVLPVGECRWARSKGVSADGESEMWHAR
jgi:hypothetical protein